MFVFSSRKSSVVDATNDAAKLAAASSVALSAGAARNLVTLPPTLMLYHGYSHCCRLWCVCVCVCVAQNRMRRVGFVSVKHKVATGGKARKAWTMLRDVPLAGLLSTRAPSSATVRACAVCVCV